MICSLSGDLATNPVVTPNGDIFERRLIVQHLQAAGTCPITDNPLSEDDLIPIKVANQEGARPRHINDSSIPGLLQTFQNEWDAIMLETFNLKKHLETSRREVALAMYQSDAATRVIARLMKERDEAREELEKWKTAARRASTARTEEFTPLSSDVKSVLSAATSELQASRPEKIAQTEKVTVETLQTCNIASSHPTHKASSPGILSVDVNKKDTDIIVTGGVDTTAVIFNKSTRRKEATLTGHTGPVNTVVFHDEHPLLATGSADSTVRIWSQDGGEYQTIGQIQSHKSGISQCAFHEKLPYLFTASSDCTWSLYDAESEQVLTQILDPDSSPLTCGQLHPDGMIYATGTEDNLVRIWNVRSLKNIVTFEGHKGRITDLSFSDNGVYLATASAVDNTIKIWDLRQKPKLVNTLTLNDTPSCISYGPGGSYLAVGTGREIRLFNGKRLDHVKNLDEHVEAVTGIAWGPACRYLASTSMDRTLKLWSVQD
eukprot:TRINITY_DN8493_c0_g1_i1.p1 TRINITY_DN8493_c0_g1~~TRINITY_DN8493_c0_g1_i1.p1  ORF type:complete len:489 (-),score=135.00 TRINITY_DN8493_c0_g1_i1:31-1497(-)